LKIANAQIQFNENGTPYATQFEDLYFSDAQGIDETNHVLKTTNYCNVGKTGQINSLS
jgi:tRNA 5-methylaminomethyl-2-thiouridine biosynthesis bifunctional protein